MLANFDPEKQAQVQNLLDQPVLARLATANPATCQPHVVPLWFLWDGEQVWFSGFASTRKFKDLLKNPNCAIIVEPANPQESKLQAILLEGQADVIQADRALIEEMATQIYRRYLDEEGLQDPTHQSWIRDP